MDCGRRCKTGAFRVVLCRYNAFPYPTYPARTRGWVSLAAPGGPMVTLGYAGDSARQVPAGSSFGQF